MNKHQFYFDTRELIGNSDYEPEITGVDAHDDGIYVFQIDGVRIFSNHEIRGLRELPFNKREKKMDEHDRLVLILRDQIREFEKLLALKDKTIQTLQALIQPPVYTYNTACPQGSTFSGSSGCQGGCHK